MVLEVLTFIGVILLVGLLLKKEKRVEPKAFIEDPAVNMLKFENQTLSNQVDRLESEIERLDKARPEVNNLVARDTFNEVKNEKECWESEFHALKEVHDRFMSEKKSKEVRLGAIAETLTPFLEGFPYNPKKLRSLGSPIDYIAFEEDEIVLIEVKSGNSQLGSNQRNIRDLVKEGKVRFEVHRIDENGLGVK